MITVQLQQATIMYSIQLLLILGVLVSVMGYHPLHTKEIEAAKKACNKELNIASDDLNVTGPKYRCFAQCVMKKMNIVDDKGGLIASSIPDTLQKYTKSCAGAKKIDTCEAATAFGICIKKEATTHLKSLSSECATETKTEVKFEESDFKNILPKLYNDALACYYRCLLVKTKGMNEQNEVNLKMAEKYVVVDNFNLEETVKTCSADNQQTDKCLQAVHRGRCIGEKIAQKKLTENV